MNPSLRAVLDSRGDVDVEVLSDLLQVPAERLAESIGIDASDVEGAPTDRDSDTKERLRQLADVLRCTAPWAGSVEMAWAHYRSYPIPALGGMTPEALLASRRADELLEYLQHLDEGGYA